MSTAGVGDSWGNLPWLSKAFLRWTNVKYALEDHGLVDKEIRLTKMHWTLVRAVRLQFDDQKPTDTKTDVKTLGSKGDGMSLTDSNRFQTNFSELGSVYFVAECQNGRRYKAIGAVDSTKMGARLSWRLVMVIQCTLLLVIEQRYKASLTPHTGTIPPYRPYPVGDALFHTMSDQWLFDFESVDNCLLVIKVESTGANHGLKPLERDAVSPRECVSAQTGGPEGSQEGKAALRLRSKRIGDAALLVQSAWSTFRSAQHACGEHHELTRDLSSLHKVLQRLSNELSDPDSLLNRADNNRQQELLEHVCGCEEVLNVMNRIVEKYNRLVEAAEGRGGVKKLWQKVQFGNGEVRNSGEIRLKLSAYTAAILMSLNLCSLGSLGRVKKRLNSVGGDLDGLRDTVDWIAANITAKSPEGTVWTSYDNGDKGFWRELRRGLVSEGYWSSVIRKHKHLIKDYVEGLGNRGVFDQEEDMQGGMRGKSVRLEDIGEVGTKLKGSEEVRSEAEEESKVKGSKTEDFAVEEPMAGNSMHPIMTAAVAKTRICPNNFPPARAARAEMEARTKHPPGPPPRQPRRCLSRAVTIVGLEKEAPVRIPTRCEHRKNRQPMAGERKIKAAKAEDKEDSAVDRPSLPPTPEVPLTAVPRRSSHISVRLQTPNGDKRPGVFGLKGESVAKTPFMVNDKPHIWETKLKPSPTIMDRPRVSMAGDRLNLADKSIGGRNTNK
ncbi:hypothetical protein G7Y89_g3837 [Cudoniella acicularis]|uniref:Uncharacterized protein n=1 Tax=Cudoniella acicularis TaxID=354080 RepID=A0A8H4RRV2_9HELO|nr:hypothetical protein G7Y89_g3837 [Cudoniella acicularis]